MGKQLKREMSKAELIESITKKAQRAQPMVRRMLLSGLKNQKIAELKRIDKNMKVSRDGWNISLD